jgi:hypothetical protein
MRVRVHETHAGLNEAYTHPDKTSAGLENVAFLPG